ncbi:MFS transporter [Streptomyces sp. NPDC059255]|uniref:MFS transporter n=1 Tax=Streptomyces sp. NPDC059255 TaxID=3346793 RepID=UPI003692597E
MTSAPSTNDKINATKGGLIPVDPTLRQLSWMTFLNAFGNGLFYPISILYFTRIVGIDTTRVGISLTVAGLFGLAAGLPAGRASDRWGSRRVLAVLWLGSGITMATYPLVHGYGGFLVVVVLFAVLNQASWGVKGALIADVLPFDTRVEARGYLRMVGNVAMAMGGALGAVALQADTRTAYSVLLLFNAVTFLVPALRVGRLPLRSSAQHLTEQSASPPESRWRAVRDLPFLTVTALNAVLVLQVSLLEVGIPLWIVENTQAPRWSVSLLLVVNCVLVALLQVRATRRASDVPGAVKSMGRSGVLLGTACLVFALSAGLPPLWAVTVLVIAAVIQVLAEVLSAAGGWTLGYELADPRAHGVYQGVYNSGAAAAMMAGPALITVTAVAHGTVGWLALAILFAVAGLAVAPAVRWAQRDGAWRGEQ